MNVPSMVLMLQLLLLLLLVTTFLVVMLMMMLLVVMLLMLLDAVDAVDAAGAVDVAGAVDAAGAGAVDAVERLILSCSICISMRLNASQCVVAQLLGFSKRQQ